MPPIGRPARILARDDQQFGFLGGRIIEGDATIAVHAQAEGQLTVIALPRDWANYGEMIDTFSKKYGIKVNELDPNAGSGDEIQAIVGFIRSWQPTAPAVATLARGAGGPWWAGGRQSTARAGQAASALDWRVFLLIGGVLSAAAVLVGLAVDRLRRLPVT